MKDNNIIELKGITKSYGKDTILDNLSLNIKKNEFLTLLGPSGCGKTTTLKIIAGFETADSGQVVFENNIINDIPPYERQLNTVFQKYALFPHMNVYDNIAFGLKIKKVPKDEIDKKVTEMLKMVALSGFEKRSIDSLSGGQQQRVAIARALVNEPEVLLLDEPLGALDLKLRKEMQIELKKIQQRLGITFIFVTHDQEEAMSITDAIVLMKDGVLQQKEAPQEMYRKPANQFVASFMGTPPMGFMNGKVENGKVFIGSSILGDAEVANGDVVVGVRPESWRLSQEEGNNATVKMVEVIGRDKLMTVDIEGQSVRCLIDSDNEVNVSDVVKLTVKPQAIHVFDTTSGHRLG